MSFLVALFHLYGGALAVGIYREGVQFNDAVEGCHCPVAVTLRLLQTAVEHQHLLGLAVSLHKPRNILGGIVEFPVGKKRLAAQQVGVAVVFAQVYRLSKHSHRVRGVFKSDARLGIEVHQFGHVLVHEHRLLARVRHSVIVLHHIRHVSHSNVYLHVVGLRLGEFLQVFISHQQVALTYESLTQIVACLGIVLYLQRVREAFHGIFRISLHHRLLTVIFQYVEVMLFSLFLVFFRSLWLAPEQCFEKIHLP